MMLLRTYVSISLLTWTCFFFLTIDCSRILGIFTLEGYSHFSYQESIMKSLLEAGHHVTIVAPFKSKLQHENLTEISSKIERSGHAFSALADKQVSWFSVVMGVLDTVEEECRHFVSLETLKDIKLVDVIFIEMTFLWQCYLPFASKFGVPIIGTTPHAYFSIADVPLGNPRLPSIVPADSHYMEPKMNFFQRLWMTFYEAETNILLYLERYKMRKLYEELFPIHQMDSLKVSLVFLNNHVSLTPRLSVQNIINIGAINVKTAKLKPLPDHLKSFLDGAKHGVILFSLGSVTTKAALSSDVKSAIIQTFKKIPQRVIWKINEKLEGISANVLLNDWLPQREILAHKNVVAFICHAGINSVHEAVYFGVPMIMLPIWADQPVNSAILTSLKVGKHLNPLELTEEKLTSALNEIINETEYQENMKELSQRFKDDPMSPAELVVYWTEYVIKYKGAPHLRFSGADMPVYQYFLIDVIAFIIICLIFFAFVSIYLDLYLID